jgi:hypothetical protein
MKNITGCVAIRYFKLFKAKIITQIKAIAAISRD